MHADARLPRAPRLCKGHEHVEVAQHAEAGLVEKLDGLDVARDRPDAEGTEAAPARFGDDVIQKTAPDSCRPQRRRHDDRLDLPLIRLDLRFPTVDE